MKNVFKDGKFFYVKIENIYALITVILWGTLAPVNKITLNSLNGMSFSSYAYMCIRSRLLVCYRNMRKYREEEIYSIDNHPNIDYCLSMASSCVSENPIAYHHTKEFNEDIGTFVSKLSKEDQEIFRMRVEKYSYKQIAEKLNISTKRIDNRLRKLRENLRKHLNEGY